MPELRLMYAHNWEDPQLEIEALDIKPGDAVVAIAGGGCTALSLLAQGPRRLHAVDCNPAQVHLLRLKLAAVSALAPSDAAEFLGGFPSQRRLDVFASLAGVLDEDTARFWSEHRTAIANGVLTQGRIERYFAFVRPLLRAVHPSRRVEQLFAQPTIDAQDRFYRDRWNTRAWRSLFLLGHKRILDRVLDPAFYRHVVARNLPAELHARAERCITSLPISENYFLSWILRGRYPEAGRPPYLNDGRCAAYAGRLETHVADLRAFLRRQPDSSVEKFYLSNVAEWLADEEIEPLFREVTRVARDGATVCYRALMVDRPLPQPVARQLEEDADVSAAFARRDRAFVNSAFHVVTVRK